MARNGSTSQRGYGWAHQRARARALEAMEDGDACNRCGGAMYRSMGKRLHYDHAEDRSGYRGLAHGRCNESAGAAKRHAKAGHKTRSAPVPTVHSRRW